MAQTKEGAAKIAAKKIGIPLSDYLGKIESGQKWCYSCRQWKLARQSFSKDASRGDGLKAKCFECLAVRNRSGPSVKERKLQKQKGFAWCRDCRQWLKTDSVRSGLCKGCKAAYERNRYHTDIAFQRDRKERAHARKRNIKPIPSIGQEILLEDFGGRCAYCPNPANSWDHIVPVSKGGQTTPGNIVPCCISCNSKKKTMDLDDWLKLCKDVHPEIEGRITLANAGLYG